MHYFLDKVMKRDIMYWNAERKELIIPKMSGMEVLARVKANIRRYVP